MKKREFLEEMKTTDGDSFSVTVALWDNCTTVTVVSDELDAELSGWDMCIGRISIEQFEKMTKFFNETLSAIKPEKSREGL